jgi:WD40 repeat protein
MKKLFTKLTSKKSHKHDKNSSHSTSTTETKQSADDDGKTIERDLKWKLERITLNTVPKNVSCAAYDPMQKIIAVGTRDGFVHIFGRYGVEFTIYPPADVQDRIKSLQFSVNTGYLLGVCANNDKTHLSIWSMKHRCLKHKIEIKKAKITSLLVPVGQNHAYFASMLDTQATVHAVNISYGTISKFKLQRDNASVTCLEAHPHHDQFIVAGMSNGNCCVFNVLKQEQNLITYSHPVISDPVTSISWSPTSDCFVVGYVSGEVIIWEIQKNLLQQLNSPTPIQQPLSTNIQTPLTVLRNRGPRPVSVHWIG